jgi:hypothetical protein
MNTYRTLTREARAVCVILAIGILALLWAIQVDASLGDDYGALVLAGALATISALGAFVVTSELRDSNAKQLRARMNYLHTQQVNTLSNAIAKLETDYEELSQSYRMTADNNDKTTRALVECVRCLASDDQEQRDDTRLDVRSLASMNAQVITNYARKYHGTNA